MTTKKTTEPNANPHNRAEKARAWLAERHAYFVEEMTTEELLVIADREGL
ncbi:hypothetical protein [Acrocarpospora sp. B8E8]